MNIFLNFYDEGGGEWVKGWVKTTDYNTLNKNKVLAYLIIFWVKEKIYIKIILYFRITKNDKITHQVHLTCYPYNLISNCHLFHDIPILNKWQYKLQLGNINFVMNNFAFKTFSFGFQDIIGLGSFREKIEYQFTWQSWHFWSFLGAKKTASH